MISSTLDHDYDKAPTDDINVPHTATNEQIAKLLDVWSSRIDPTQQLFPKDHLFKDPLIRRLKPTEAFCYTLGIIKCSYRLNRKKTLYYSY